MTDQRMKVRMHGQTPGRMPYDVPPRCSMLRFIAVLLLCTTASAQTARFIQPQGLSKNPAYTHVVEVSGGRTLLISGQVALDAQGKLVGAGDFAAQAKQVMDNLGT